MVLGMCFVARKIDEWILMHHDFDVHASLVSWDRPSPDLVYLPTKKYLNFKKTRKENKPIFVVADPFIVNLKLLEFSEHL